MFRRFSADSRPFRWTSAYSAKLEGHRHTVLLLNNVERPLKSDARQMGGENESNLIQFTLQLHLHVVVLYLCHYSSWNCATGLLETNPLFCKKEPENVSEICITFAMMVRLTEIFHWWTHWIGWSLRKNWLCHHRFTGTFVWAEASGLWLHAK